MKYVVESIFSMIRNSTELEQYQATISMGITLMREGDTIDSLLKRTDTASYQEKENEKNRYVVI